MGPDLGGLGFDVSHHLGSASVGVGDCAGGLLISFGAATISFDLGVVQHAVRRLLSDRQGAGHRTFGIVQASINGAGRCGGLEGTPLLGDLSLKTTDCGIYLAAVIPLGAHREVLERKLAVAHRLLSPRDSPAIPARVVPFSSAGGGPVAGTLFGSEPLLDRAAQPAGAAASLANGSAQDLGSEQHDDR